LRIDKPLPPKPTDKPQPPQAAPQPKPAAPPKTAAPKPLSRLEQLRQQKKEAQEK
jgi:hypothetical protein